MRHTTLLLSLLFFYDVGAQPVSHFIHVDQFGYLIDADKVAVLSNPQDGYNSSDVYQPGNQIELRKATNHEVILSLTPQVWNSGATDPACGDAGWWLDFSTLTTPGDYYLYDDVNDETSATFRIHNTIYNHLLVTAGRTYFYNRCNYDKALPYAESNWTDGMNFLHPLQDANCRYIYDPTNSSLEKDLSGGWFDAGDYNKYVTFAFHAVHQLLAAYEENPQAFSDAWNIPESGNGIPDLIDEIKWETDWLLKMNNFDGSTHIKMGSQNHNENAAAPPSVNVDQRFYGPTCTSASIAVASMLAHAANVFSQFPSLVEYADTLTTRAIQSWDYVQPYIENNQLETGCDDGSIVAGDADWDVSTQLNHALVAALRLYQRTGDSEYQTFIIDHYQTTPPISDGFWGPYLLPTYDALLAYTTTPGADVNVSNAILNSFQTAANNNWNGFFGFSNDNLYRAFMPSWSYHWGSNQSIANYGNLNQLLVHYQINSGQQDDYIAYAQNILHYFHGVNPQGLVYLSNMNDRGAERSCNQFYHTWFADGTDWDDAQSSLYGPAPGFVPGGPNHDFSVPSISPPFGQPDQKCYLDFNTSWPDNSWEITENAIYYQAAYIRLLANFVVDEVNTGSENIFAASDYVEIFPNPTDQYFTIRGDLADYHIDILNASGQIVQSLDTIETELVVDMNGLGAGLYFIRLQNIQSNELCVQKIIKTD